VNRQFQCRGALAVACAAAFAAGAAPSAAAQTIAITGGRVHPVVGAPIENGTVLIRDGRIAAVGADVAIPSDAQRVDATGKVVTPGLVNAATTLGLVEIAQEPSTRDVGARGRDGIAAAFRAWEGYNPASAYIPAARVGGVTTALVAPSGGLVQGQAALLDLGVGSASEMLRRAPVAMVVGDMGGYRSDQVGARGEFLLRLRELLDDTRAYQRNRASFERGETRELVASRSDLEAMIPVIQGRLPVAMSADRATDIEAALALAREYGLRLIVVGGAEAWMVDDALAAARVPVLVGAMNNIPTSFSALGTRQENAAILRRAGVTVALIGNAGGGDEELFNVRNVKYEAGNAVAYGMSWDDALRAVTLAPAEIFGVADRIGALRPGMDANVVVWSGDPLELLTVAERVYIRGVEMPDETRQRMLMDRYRTLPPDYDTPADRAPR
jgi:imidazolonepropionase-like amidohydrolase